MEMASKTSSNNTSISFWDKLYDWSLTGVDFSYDGNGGLECRDHVTFNQRLNETLIGMGVPSLAYLLYYAYSKIMTSKPQKQINVVSTYALTN